VRALLYIVGTHLGVLSTLPAQTGAIPLPADLEAVAGILAAGFLAFCAFIGFEDMVTLAEEVRDAQRPCHSAWSSPLRLRWFPETAVSIAARSRARAARRRGSAP
jgi:amino acid transporter